MVSGQPHRNFLPLYQKMDLLDGGPLPEIPMIAVAEVTMVLVSIQYWLAIDLAAPMQHITLTDHQAG